MPQRDEIDKALNAHGMWVQRLKDAIATGKSDFQVANVQVDNRCDFGKWFYGLPPADRSKDVCVRVQKLHAEFHGEAARILGMAVSGKKLEAEKGLAMGNKFMDLSGKLSLALNQWKMTM